MMGQNAGILAIIIKILRNTTARRKQAATSNKLLPPRPLNIID
jgi:hypothetical protein